jgi:hypothetical protein
MEVAQRVSMQYMKMLTEKLPYKKNDHLDDDKIW